MSKQKKTDLYGIIKWIEGHPILDRMPYFDNIEAATEDALEREKIAKKYAARWEKKIGSCIYVKYTIIRLREHYDL